MIALVDTGVGSVASLERALRRVCSVQIRVTRDPEVVARADRIALPGQGNFGAAIRALEDAGLLGPLRAALQEGKPFLGVCLGLHLLFERSEEAPGAKGLYALPGIVARLRAPHVGWSPVNGALPGWYYFCHSYAVITTSSAIVSRVEVDGTLIPALARLGVVWGAQFHPEKSGRRGLDVLKAWMEAA